MKKILVSCTLATFFNSGLFAQSENFKTNAICDSLNTIYNHTYQNHGAMFNVVAKDSIVLKQLSANLATGTYKYYIYYKPGSFVGFETNASAWTMIDSAIVQSSNNGSTITDQPTVLPINMGLPMSVGDTFALYLTSPIVSRVYLKSTVIPWATDYASDSSISISVARSVYQLFGVPFSTPQIWNGTVSYCKSTPTKIEKTNSVNLSQFFVSTSNNALFVKVSDELLKNVSGMSLKITDVMNREIKATSLSSSFHTIDITNIAKGIYFCTLYDRNNVIGTMKFYVE